MTRRAMNEKAQWVHAANRDRILAERAAMEARYRNTRRFSSPPLFKVKSVGEAELSEPEGVERNCMRCAAAFMSTGPGHRMCCPCRRLTEGFGGC